MIQIWKEGYQVISALSAEAALKMLDENVPDLILLDLMLPGMDGMEVMRRARQMHPELLIIILTGFATLENAIAAQAAWAVISGLLVTPHQRFAPRCARQSTHSSRSHSIESSVTWKRP